MLRNGLYQYGKEDGRVPAHLHFGKEVFDNMVKNKHVIGLINADTGENMTYDELAQMTADIALSLARAGVRKGDVVCVCSETRFEVPPTIIGIMCAGATYSPMDLTYGAGLLEELSKGIRSAHKGANKIRHEKCPLLHRLKIVRPKIMFCSPSAYEAHKSTFEDVGSIQHYILYGNTKQDGALLFDEFLTEVADLNTFQPVPVDGWEDVAFVVYSSGTTGLPKGVPVTHLAFLLNSQCFVEDSFFGVRFFITRELYYTYGLMYALSCLRVCATIVYSSCQTEEDMLNVVQHYKIKVLQLVPTNILRIVKSSDLDQYDLSSVEWIIAASTPLSSDSVNAVKRRFPNINNVIQMYGMSEAGSICNAFGALKSKPGSSGVACSGFVIKVVDIDTRKPVGPNIRGEICIKGPSVMKAYLNNVGLDCKDSEGFLKTGDVGYYDEDGYFFIVNRIKELIKFNDISIAPAEFEALLQLHPAVREAGVVGISHPEHGELPVALVVLQPGESATEEELVHHVNSRVTYRMRLAGGVRFIERLPRGAGDKLNRQELKRILEKMSSN